MTLANWITVSRLVLAPIIFYAITSKMPWVFVFGLLTLAGFTDVLDGYFARKRREISQLGKVLDPVADKMVIASVMLGFWRRSSFSTVLVWAYVVKELFQLAGGALLLARERRVIPSNIWGKSSSVVFYCGFFLLLIWKQGGMALVAAGLILSIIALMTYSKASITNQTTRS